MNENDKLNFSKEDLKKTKGSFQSRSSRLLGVLKGPEYDRLVNSVNNSWESSEADEYLKLLNESLTQVEKLIKIYNTAVQSLIDSKLR